MIPDHIKQVSYEVIDANDPAATKEFNKWVRLEIASKLPSNAKIISLDGWDGAGKSTLGRELASLLQYKFIDLDDYLIKGQDRFLDALQLNRISSKIERELSRDSRIVIVGCLVKLVLERSGFNANFRIYVMRISGMISNYDVEHVDQFDALYGDLSADDLIAQEEETICRWTKHENPASTDKITLPELQCELIKYHKQYRPHDSADLIVKIIRRA